MEGKSNKVLVIREKIIILPYNVTPGWREESVEVSLFKDLVRDGERLFLKDEGR